MVWRLGVDISALVTPNAGWLRKFLLWYFIRVDVVDIHRTRKFCVLILFIV